MNRDIDQFYELFSAITMTTYEIESLLDEFSILVKEPETINSKLKSIKWVYMSQTIIAISKVTSLVGSDKSGIRELKSFSSLALKKDISELELKHKVLLAKVRSNRSRIFVHLDISKNGSHKKMGLSKVAIQEMVTHMIKYYVDIGKDNLNSPESIKERYKKSESGSPEQERYSFSDFLDDSDEIRILINEINRITSEVNLYLYESSPKV